MVSSYLIPAVYAYLSFGEVLAIVLAPRCADIVQRRLQAGRIVLDERNPEVEHRARVRLPDEVETTRDVRALLVNMKVVVRSGPAHGEGREECAEKQAGCNHLRERTR